MEYVANQPKKLGNLNNFRDIGGYINNDGAKLKENIIFRSDDLSGVTEEVAKELFDKDITTVVNFRNSREMEGKHELDRPEFNYFEIPIKGDLDFSDPNKLIYNLYISFLENDYKDFFKALEIVAEADKATVYHCTAGKDRTGILSMLILGILDVNKEQIIADYVPSGDNNLSVRESRRKKLKDQGLGDVPEEIFLSREKDMRRTIEYLDKEYSGLSHYLEAKGLDGSVIELLRQKMLGD